MKKLIYILLSKNLISSNGSLNVEIDIINVEAKQVFNVDNYFKSPTDYYESLSF
jgi:hypothetical protein